MDRLPPPPPRHPASHSRTPSAERALPPAPPRHLDASSELPSRTPPASAPPPPPPIPPIESLPAQSFSKLPPPAVPPPWRAPPPPPELPNDERASASASDAEDEDETLELLASHIASETTEVDAEEPWVSGVGAYSSLRRRLTTRTRGRAKATVDDGDDAGSIDGGQMAPAEEGEEAKAARKALEVLEDEEVAAFLGRVGKQVQEVRLAVKTEDIPFPAPSAFATDAGGTDWLAFGRAYLATAISVYTPQSLLSPPKPSRLHISTTRSYLERLYIIVPPGIWERILKAEIGAIWRWESPSTIYWFITYVILWYYNIVLILIPGILLYHITKKRLFPPSSAEILRQATDRVRRQAEAAQLSTQLQSTSRLGFVTQGARGLYHNIRGDRTSSPQGSALARGLEGSAMLGGMMAAGGTSRPSREIPKTSALARAIAGTSGVTGGVAAPSRVSLDELRPQQAPTPTLESESEETSDTESSVKSTSLYGTATEAVRIFGPPLEEYLGQASDFAEKIKNLLVHTDHPAVTPVCVRLFVICVFILLCPTWLFYKGAWAYVGCEFFFLWRFRETHPEWRRALMPWWWIVFDAPTDAEYALYVLQKRARAKKPLRGAKTLRRLAKQRARGTSLSDPVSTASTTRSSPQPPPAATDGTAALASFGQSRQSTFVNPPGDLVGTYFCLLHAVPGNLVICSNIVKFAPTRGFRTLGLKRFSKRFSGGAGGDESSDGDAYSFGGGKEDEDMGLLEVRPEEIVGIKKEKRLGFEGMQLTSRDGKSWRLTNVARRDEAFNKLVSMSPAAWSQS